MKLRKPVILAATAALGFSLAASPALAEKDLGRGARDVGAIHPAVYLGSDAVWSLLDRYFADLERRPDGWQRSRYQRGYRDRVRGDGGVLYRTRTLPRYDSD